LRICPSNADYLAAIAGFLAQSEDSRAAAAVTFDLNAFASLFIFGSANWRIF